MKSLVLKINSLKKEKINQVIKKRESEFVNFKKTPKNLFSELCFCVLTANYNAKKAIEIQKKIGSGFVSFSESLLKKKLKEYGYRYPNKRAEYIVYNRRYFYEVPKIISTYKKEDLREWLVKNIKGFGYKEASHFLRNIGFSDFAIIDFHIIDILEREKIIKRPKKLDKKTYRMIENILREIAKKTKTTLLTLDLYLWYLETGEVLK